jgi:DNA polymerase I-like protein with 3'-5' exonuclease and polymerase domains
LKQPLHFARKFLDMHREIFADYWHWSDGVVRQAMHQGFYTSRHGWHYAVCPPVNERSLRNWPIQTAGADILRCAVILADALGIEMLATAHDAVLIQAPEAEIDRAAASMAWCMQHAAALLTGGFELRVDIERKLHGEQFIDERGRRTFAVVDKFLRERTLHAA